MSTLLDFSAAEPEMFLVGTNPPKPPKPTQPGNLVVTRILSRRPALLTKVFALAREGTILKTAVAQLTEGEAEQIEVAGLADFASLLEALPPSAALTYGVPTGHQRASLVREADLPQHPGAITRTRRFFGFRRAPGILMLDHDADTEHLTPEDLIATLRALAPCLRTVPMLWRASASSGVHRAGEDAGSPTLKGQRIYIPVVDAALIPDGGSALVELLWGAGYGRIVIGAAGQALERTLIDAAVWQPERLDFAASPVLQPGLARNVPPPFVDGGPDLYLDLKALIAAADGSVEQRAANARKTARASATPLLDAARSAWVDKTAASRLPNGDPEQISALKATLTRAAVHTELTGDFLLRCADGSTPTVGQLLDNPAQWHGQRFADPLEPDYDDDARIAWANLRSGRAPYVYSHAHGGRKFKLLRPAARIQLRKGERARVVDQTIDVLRTRGELYDMGDGATLARITDNSRAVPVSRDWLADHLDRVLAYYSLHATKPELPPEEQPEDAPVWAAMRIVAKDGERRFQRLDAVVTAPTLRADGSIVDEPGYDAPSRLLLASDGPTLPHIPPAPTIDDAREALRVLWWPLRLFPLVDAVDHGVVLAALLTACVRASLPTAPGFAVDAPTAGSGKTLLAQVIGSLCLGEAPASLPPAGNEDDEARKRLFAALREGHRVLLWDNCREPLGNAALDAFLTAPVFADRILGVSQTASLPNRALFLATGNNLRLIGDTCRRLLTARLDACVERPYAREFDFCPRAVTLAHRLELIAAALTLIRAWITAGRPRHGKGRTASFEFWDDLVRQPVCWIASWDERFSDPLKATDRAFAHDPETAKLAALQSAWAACVGQKPTTTAELIAAATQYDFAPPDAAKTALADAIDEIAGDRGGKINRRILGRWIERHAERRHDGSRLVRGKLKHGAPTWMLVRDAAPRSA